MPTASRSHGLWQQPQVVSLCRCTPVAQFHGRYSFKLTCISPPLLSINPCDMPPMITNQLLGSRIPVLEITLVRSSLSFAVTVLIARLRNVSPMFGHREVFWKLVARGVTGSLAMATYYASVLLLPMADAATLFFTNPVACWE